MRSAQVYRYQIPMDAGVVLRDRRLKTREGLILQLTADGVTGYGEIAPLPGFSLESLEQAESELRAWAAAWQLDPQVALPELPAVAFGVSCALAELDGTLPDTADYRVAPLCSGDPDELFAVLDAIPGDKVAKVKVGLYEAIRDGMIVTLLLEALPELRLRLDANRSWTPEKARQFARYVAPELRSRIDFFEEPCRTPQDSLAFAQETGIALAWDETLREPGFTLKREPALAAIVIKPTLTGSLERVRAQVEAAHKLGLRVVISSAIESSLGLTQLARIAAWLTPDTVPGLDTLSLMQAQLLRRWPGSDLPCLERDSLVAI
ncbi:o-succinylbenzoate synthase [Salmonella enterica subsp. enterica serovar Choleraesuis]|nr:o-succinylbenzoate synthase [Salmonella enterica subsp. enterica serovar Choleraesuis]